MNREEFSLDKQSLILSAKARLAAVGLSLAGLLVGCGADARKPAAAVRDSVPVVVATAVQKDVPVQVRAIGTVEAYSTVSVKSMVAGEITDVAFREGQDVKKGELLFIIDKRPFQAALSQIQATLAKDTAQAANATAQAERYTRLEKAGVISHEQAEIMRTSANALEEAVRADKAAVETASVNLQYCDIYSPIDGRTGNLMVHQGNVVKANDVPLVTINQVRPIYVTFSIPEQFLAEVKKYNGLRPLKVIARLPNDPQPAEGALSFFDNAVDTATGTIKLKGTFANSESKLWPGQFADVSVTLTTQPKAIVVPSQAVQTGQKGQYVFVVKPDNTAEQVNVNVARTVDGQAVIASGLQAGDTVVTDGQLRLGPKGTKVEKKAAVGQSGGGNGVVSGS